MWKGLLKQKRNQAVWKHSSEHGVCLFGAKRENVNSENNWTRQEMSSIAAENNLHYLHYSTSHNARSLELQEMPFYKETVKEKHAICSELALTYFFK